MSSTTPNLGLIRWDDPNDLFASGDLIVNWNALDNHDHSGNGKGLAIPTAGLQNQAVTNGKLAAGAVTTDKILSGNVQTNNLGDLSVATGKIADLAVTSSKLGTSAVTTSKISSGSVTGDKIADAAKLGLSDATNVRRGKAIIPGAETLTSTTYALMGTADRVANIVLPTDGLIVVAYQATWQEAVGGASRAAIFIGSTQLKAALFTLGGPTVQAAATVASTVGTDHPLTTCALGLASCDTSAYPGDVTTGQIIGQYGSSLGDLTMDIGGVNSVPPAQGGPCHIFAAAGTYNVSVQFKSSSGSVTVKNRHLWVWTIGF